MVTVPCRVCRTPKSTRLYLCRNCWTQLSPATRRALNRHDGRAVARLRELHAQIDGGRALADIEVTP
jgi:hypothetical protein